jgi:adenylosuccinate lyase
MSDHYQSPLALRYSSGAMSRIFSPQFKHSTWRRLWVALAEAEKELGLDISDSQIQELRSQVDHIDFTKAAEYEKQFRHDVMAHIHAYGDVCPTARPIIHLGATSCYVTDNSELIQLRSGIQVITQKLAQVLKQLGQFAANQRAQATLGFTHYQAAQLTSVGKRACLWTQELLMDLEELEYRNSKLRFLGVKGTTGTQASFLALFNGDHGKVQALDEAVSRRMGFENALRISGQTYSRKQDMQVLACLAGIAASAHKMATDIRLLANLKELEEPFETTQIGSSAMPYKRNPMRSERICALARFVLSLSENGSYTAATQWLERSLDDSANRRLALAESFLAVDGILNLLLNVTNGLVVYPKVIERRIQSELPFMATENILMACVQKGGDRQELHERIRQHSQAAARAVKEEGQDNHLLSLIEQDPAFGLTKEDLVKILDVNAFIGRAPQQVDAFLAEELHPALAKYTEDQGAGYALHV